MYANKMTSNEKKLALHCSGCYHWRNTSGVKACHYFLDTGELRRVNPLECDKKATSKGKVIKGLNLKKVINV